jgi:3-oxoadipate CoA-transferase alpha subunit
MINKIASSFDEAVADVFDGALLLIGGFGTAGGTPSQLIRAVARTNAKNLTVVGNTGGLLPQMVEAMSERMATLIRYPSDYADVGTLVANGQVSKGILAFPASPSTQGKMAFEYLLEQGKAELELVPQGTLAERMRAAKAGIPALYLPVGCDTVVQEGKEVREINGECCLLEYALKGDFSLIRAHKADRYGNLVYSGTSRTFNATMAGAANVTIAEVDEIVELGELDPEVIVTPGLYVDRVVVREGIE